MIQPATFRDAIEDEGHILLDCKSNIMTSLRTQFYWRAREIDDSFETPQASTEPYTTITKLLHRTVILPTLARFVREIFETTPLLRVTSEEEWMGLEQET